MRSIPSTVLIVTGLLSLSRAIAQPAAPEPPLVEQPPGTPATAPIDRFSVAGHGPIPVIIIPELGNDETTYVEFAKRHADRFTTHTLVLPGSVKGSKAPPLDRGHVRDPEWLRNASNAIRAYAHEHKLDSPVIIGQGIGGTVAYLLAIREPELARAYVVINTLPAPSVGGPGRIPPKEARSAEVDQLERARILDMTQSAWTNRARSLAPLQTPNAQRANSIIEAAKTAPISAIRRYSLEPLYLDLRTELDATKTPILVFVTLPDWVREPDRGLLRATFLNVGFNRPNVRVELLDGARQWAILDEPERFDTPLLDFLKIPPVSQPTAPSQSTPPTGTTPPEPEPK